MSARCIHYYLSVTVSRFSRGAEVENVCGIYPCVCIYMRRYTHTHIRILSSSISLCIKPSIQTSILSYNSTAKDLLWPPFVCVKLLYLSIRKLVPIILSLLTHLLKTPLPNQYVNKVLGHYAFSASPWHSGQNVSPVKGEEAIT